jgi:hypothetical protein
VLSDVWKGNIGDRAVQVGDAGDDDQRDQHKAGTRRRFPLPFDGVNGPALDCIIPPR